VNKGAYGRTAAIVQPKEQPRQTRNWRRQPRTYAVAPGVIVVRSARRVKFLTRFSSWVAPRDGWRSTHCDGGSGRYFGSPSGNGSSSAGGFLVSAAAAAAFATASFALAAAGTAGAWSAAVEGEAVDGAAVDEAAFDAADFAVAEDGAAWLVAAAVFAGDGVSPGFFSSAAPQPQAKRHAASTNGQAQRGFIDGLDGGESISIHDAASLLPCHRDVNRTCRSYQ
jgi:hypothetical protein